MRVYKVDIEGIGEILDRYTRRYRIDIPKI